MQHLPKLVRDRLNKAQPATHPDPDQLTAFAEHSLAGYERTQVIEHLAACAQCREVVALAQPLVQELPTAAPAYKPFSWLRWPMLRWGTAAAIVVIVGAAVILPKQRRMATSVPAAKLDVNPRFSAQPDKLELSVAAPKDELDQLAQPGSKTIKLSKSSAAPKHSAKDKKIYALKAEPPLAVINGQRREQESNSSLGLVAPSPTRLAPAAPLAPQRKDEENSSQVAEAGRSATVQVTAGVPAVRASEAAEVSKAKETPSKANAEKGSAIGGAVAARNYLGDFARRADAPGVVLRPTPPFSRWTIAADGALERSVDSGKTWDKVRVDNNAIFRAVCTVGAEVWAGGSAGLLYHSSDAGQHWIRVRPTADGATLTADIATVEFIDPQHGKLTTVDHQVWNTSDAGQTWQTVKR